MATTRISNIVMCFIVMVNRAVGCLRSPESETSDGEFLISNGFIEITRHNKELQSSTFGEEHESSGANNQPW